MHNAMRADRRYSSLRSAALFVVGLLVSCGGPTEPAPTAEPDPRPATPEPTSDVPEAPVEPEIPEVPRVLDALLEVPDWMAELEHPFDVEEYLRLDVPESENAAPLYLHSMREFTSNLDECFRSPGPEGADNRNRRILKAYYALRDRKPEDKLSFDEIRQKSALLGELQRGFDLLDAAQRRPTCVFATGQSFDSRVSHLQVPRVIVAALILRARSNLEGGNVDSALDDVERSLRLARDIQPRSPMIGQLVSLALEAMLIEDLIKPMLASPECNSANCRRLVSLLRAHRDELTDCWVEGHRAEYLFQIEALRQLRTGNASEEVLKLADSPTIDDETEQRERMAARLVHSAVIGARVGDYQSRKLEVGGRSVGLVIDHRARNLLGMLPASEQFDDSLVRRDVRVEFCVALACLRLHELERGELPTDLPSAYITAGLEDAPHDAYGSETLLGYDPNRSPPIVYSVAKDGEDDGGRIDWQFDKQPGDWIVPLPWKQGGMR